MIHGCAGSVPALSTTVRMTMTLPSKTAYRFGLISDTHGYLPASVLTSFRGVDAILHAGDIGSSEILSTLAQLAPVVAVRGNMDSGPWADALVEKESIRVGDRIVYVIHDVLRLRPDTLGEDCLAVIAGHTHRFSVDLKNGVLYVNPGSAGAPRQGEAPCAALVHVSGSQARAERVSLSD
jgi:putative phosphoesterase